jgi:GT2 family glycosyltransferase
MISLSNSRSGPGDIAAIIVNRNQPELTDSLVEQLRNMRAVDMDIYVIETGSDRRKMSKFADYWYLNPRFSGKCLGHNIGLAYVRGQRDYRYYWFLMNDLVFDDPETAKNMLSVMESELRMGMLSPTEPDSAYDYPGSAPIPGSVWHKVSTCDYLAVLMRRECLDEVGFLNPDFRYSWGAIFELSHRMYRNNWFIAYCDIARMKHLGGTTYGKVKGAVSREEYQRQARKWASDYFKEVYGPEWDKEFTKYLPDDVTVNTYQTVRRFWEERPSTGVRRWVKGAEKEVGDLLRKCGLHGIVRYYRKIFYGM